MLGGYLELHENIYGATYGLKYIYKYRKNSANSTDLGTSLLLAIISQYFSLKFLGGVKLGGGGNPWPPPSV